MYKFVTIEGSCGKPYDVNQCEAHANRMSSEGYILIQVYQTTTSACCSGPKGILVMIFKKVS